MRSPQNSIGIYESPYINRPGDASRSGAWKFGVWGGEDSMSSRVPQLLGLSPTPKHDSPHLHLRIRLRKAPRSSRPQGLCVCLSASVCSVCGIFRPCLARDHKPRNPQPDLKPNRAGQLASGFSGLSPR